MVLNCGIWLLTVPTMTANLNLTERMTVSEYNRHKKLHTPTRGTFKLVWHLVRITYCSPYTFYPYEHEYCSNTARSKPQSALPEVCENNPA